MNKKVSIEYHIRIKSNGASITCDYAGNDAVAASKQLMAWFEKNKEYVTQFAREFWG